MGKWTLRLTSPEFCFFIVCLKFDLQPDNLYYYWTAKSFVLIRLHWLVLFFILPMYSGSFLLFYTHFWCTIRDVVNWHKKHVQSEYRLKMQKKKITDISRYNLRGFHIELKHFFWFFIWYHRIKILNYWRNKYFWLRMIKHH